MKQEFKTYKRSLRFTKGMHKQRSRNKVAQQTANKEQTGRHFYIYTHRSDRSLDTGGKWEVVKRALILNHEHMKHEKEY